MFSFRRAGSFLPPLDLKVPTQVATAIAGHHGSPVCASVKLDDGTMGGGMTDDGTMGGGMCVLCGTGVHHVNRVHHVHPVAQACILCIRAAAIVLPVDVGKSRLRTRSVSECPETSWLCSLDETAPLSRSPDAGTNPDWAEKQHAPHPARQSAHQHAPIRKQEAQQGSFIMQLTCP